MTLQARERTVVALTALIGLILPFLGFLMARSSAWTAGETGILEALSHSPHTLAAASSVVAVVFGTPFTIAILIVFIAVYYAVTRSWRESLRIGLMLVVPLLYMLAVKDIVNRPRPSFAGALGVAPHSFSFPSGHTASAVVIMVVLMYATRATAVTVKWPVRILGGLVALCVAGSRLILGVHFPTDVLASLIVCPLIIATVSILFDRYVGRDFEAGKAAVLADSSELGND
jgi:undecaprenyl-diphosphatase